MAKLNDFIRCEDAIKEICKRTCTPGVFCPDSYCIEVKDWITDEMIVDAVEVVRCKDCKYWKTSNGATLTKRLKFCTYAIGHKYVRHDNDFCSRGERKDDKQDGNA